jgi:large subunit ribosomal protein L17
MRHQRKTVKLGRKEGHRKSLIANLAVSLIAHNRIKTTLAKAKAVLRQDEAVTKLFAEIAPRAADRKGGYTRIIKLGQRQSDASEMAFIEWVDAPVLVETATPEPKPAAKKAAKAKAEAAPAAEGEKAEKKPRAKKAEKSEDKPAE